MEGIMTHLVITILTVITVAICFALSVSYLKDEETFQGVIFGSFGCFLIPLLIFYMIV